MLYQYKVVLYYTGSLVNKIPWNTLWTDNDFKNSHHNNLSKCILFYQYNLLALTNFRIQGKYHTILMHLISICFPQYIIKVVSQSTWYSGKWNQELNSKPTASKYVSTHHRWRNYKLQISTVRNIECKTKTSPEFIVLQEFINKPTKPEPEHNCISTVGPESRFTTFNGFEKW